jgi:hypothetical protein
MSGQQDYSREKRLVLVNGGMIIDTESIARRPQFDENYNNTLYLAPNSRYGSSRRFSLGGVMLYGLNDWHDVTTLSVAKWNLHGRETIDIFTKGISEVVYLLQQEQQKNDIVDDDTIHLIRDMFNGLDDSKKSEFCDKYKNTKFEKVLNDKCSICDVFYKCDDDKKNCIHYNCNKMCGSCYYSWKNKNECESKETTDNEKCPSCKQTQLLKCPICFESVTEEQIVKSEKCVHYVCWKCYGMSHKTNNPIIKCPICRGKF